MRENITVAENNWSTRGLNVLCCHVLCTFFTRVTRASYMQRRIPGAWRSAVCGLVEYPRWVRRESMYSHELSICTHTGGRYISAFPLDALAKVRMHFYKPAKRIYCLRPLIRISTLRHAANAREKESYNNYLLLMQPCVRRVRRVRRRREISASNDSGW